MLETLDTDVLPTFAIGLGQLLDHDGRDTQFILVWFLDWAKLGLAFDYTEPILDDDEMEQEEQDGSDRAAQLKGSFIGVDFEFSLATLEGAFRLGDEKDPENELSTQLAADITLYLHPFAYKGFRVEDACRYEGVIQPFSKNLLLRATDETSV